MTVHPQSNRPNRELRTKPAPARYSHGTREGRLTVAPFRAWRGSTHPVAWGPTFNAVACGSFDTSGPREGIQPRCSGLRVTGTAPPHLARPSGPVARRAHVLRWLPRPHRSTYREYASGAAFGRRLAAGPFSPTGVVCDLTGFNGWRRGWDSNPRYSCPYTAFPVPHLRPLGHPSCCPGNDTALDGGALTAR